VVSEFIELRSPAGNNYPTGNNYPAGNNWVNQGIWAHAVRPYGFGGGFWRFLGFLGRGVPIPPALLSGVSDNF
jgi:hypothetical protein